MTLLASVSEASAALLAHARPPAARPVPVAEAVGAVLAADLRVAVGLPEAAQAARPGYAVRAADTFGASPYSPLVLPPPARTIRAGETMPDGTDAVLPDDAATRLAGGGLEVTDGVPAGHWARRAGSEVAAGTVLRAAGERLRPLDVAVALAAGIAAVAVVRPVIGLAGGGPEHAAALARLLGGMASLRPTGRDLRPGEADLALEIGTGPERPSGAVLAAGLALRPGEETRMALASGVPTLGIADRLDALLAVGWGLLLPCLSALTGASPATSSEPMPLTRKIASTVGVTEIALLRRAPDGLEPLAVGDLALGVLPRAEYWLAVPPGSEGFERGAVVRAFEI